MFESSQTRRNVQVYQFSNYTSLIQSHKSLGLIKKINTISVIACYSTTKSQHIILKKITAQDSICTVQFHTILHHTHTISYHSITHHIIPDYMTSYRATSHHIPPNYIIPYLIALYHTLPNYTIPYAITPYHPHHTTSHHTILNTTPPHYTPPTPSHLTHPAYPPHLIIRFIVSQL